MKFKFNSTQFAYGLKQAAIMGGLALAGALIESEASFGLDPTVALIVGAALTAVYRALEAARDGGRAASGHVQPQDVGAFADPLPPPIP